MRKKRTYTNRIPLTLHSIRADIKRSYHKGKNFDFHKKIFATISKFPKLRKQSLTTLSTAISEMKSQLIEFSTTLRRKNEDKKTLRELELKLFEAQETLSSKASSSELSETQISQLEKSGNYSVANLRGKLTN